MGEPIVTTSRRPTGFEVVEQSHTYKELLEVFDDDSTVIGELVRRCQAYEARIETAEAIVAKLQRVRDWLKHAANAEGDIVDEIDSVLDAAAAKEA